MIPRLRPLAVLLVPALLLLSSRAGAQETFQASSGGSDEPAPPAPAPAARPRKPVALRLDGAYAPRRLFGLGITGADLGLAIGAQTSHHAAWWGTSRITLGSTENGLSVWSFRLGSEVEAVIDPIRFGIGASFFGVGVSRAQRDETLVSYGIEGRAFARVDCMRNDDFAIFLRGGIDGAVEAKSNAAFWGPAIGIGFELGISGKKPEAWSASTARPPLL